MKPFQGTSTQIYLFYSPLFVCFVFRSQEYQYFFSTFEIARGVCLTVAAPASNILVCWETRITRDGLQTRAGTGRALTLYLKAAIVWTSVTLNRLKSYLEWNTCLVGPLGFQVRIFVSGCSPGTTLWGSGRERRSLQSFISGKLRPAGHKWRHSSLLLLARYNTCEGPHTQTHRASV